MHSTPPRKLPEPSIDDCPDTDSPDNRSDDFAADDLVHCRDDGSDDFPDEYRDDFDVTSRAPKSSLCLVATPIGNLGDITARAVKALETADVILAEDTRHSRKLLTHLGMDTTRLHRLDANASEHALHRVIKWLKQGKFIALITDAGMPCVSDPGAALVRLALAEGIELTCTPGPSAVTMAVACSGLVDGPFYFAGFPPRQPTDLSVFVHDIATRQEPCVLFESPYRVADTLRALADIMPLRKAVVARELTKAFEQFVRGSLTEIVDQQNAQHTWMGEITIVLGPWTSESDTAPTDSEIDRRINELLQQGNHTRTVANLVAAWSGQNRRDLYARVLQIRDTNKLLKS